MNSFSAPRMFVLAASLAACTNPYGEDESNLRSGQRADGAEFAAIGALGSLGESGLSVSCTGTLVAPNKVVTAKHCVTSDGEGATLDKVDEGLFFVPSAKVTPTDRAYRVLRGQVPDPVEGGFIGYGSDVALLTLEEVVPDVIPMSVSLDAPRAGEALMVVGFGFDENNTKGERRKGVLTVRANEGQAAQSVWPTRADFDAFVEKVEGDRSALDPNDDRSAQAERFYGYGLLSNHEVFAGLAPGNAQTCRSDSGGPLLRGRTVVGVVSGSLKLTRSPCGNYGGFFATFGPTAQKVFEEPREQVAHEVFAKLPDLPVETQPHSAP